MTRRRLVVPLVVLIVALALLLTGCEENNGYYAVVYPYTVTVAEQEFTFLKPNPPFPNSIRDVNGHRYSFRKYKSDPYRVIEISYPSNVTYTWKQHMEHENIAFGDYSEPSDLTGYTPGEILVKAIQMPAPEMEYVPPQKKPKEKKSFPWEGLVFAFAGLIQLLIPDFVFEMFANLRYGRWVEDPTPTEAALQWIRIESVLLIAAGILQLMLYFFF
jgi:hypothetical protein